MILRSRAAAASAIIETFMAGAEAEGIEMYKFPSASIFITRLVIFATLTLNLEDAFGQDNASRTYQCAAKDAVAVEDNGTLDKSDPGAEVRRQHFDRMVISVPSGHITYPSTDIREDRIVQMTGVAEDYVLISSLYFRRNKTAANATTDFIRLRTAIGQPQATFTAFQLSYLVTGTCDIVQ